MYGATTMAQIDVLLKHGQSYSEVVKESVIEAVDSLCKCLHHKSIAFMVDKYYISTCLGSRVWAPHFDYILEQAACPQLETANDKALFHAYLNHSVQEAVTRCGEMQPSVDIPLVTASSVLEC